MTWSIPHSSGATFQWCESFFLLWPRISSYIQSSSCMVPGYAAWSAKMGLPYHGSYTGAFAQLRSFLCLVVVVLQCSRLQLEPSLSRDQLSGILPCLSLSLAYGSGPRMLIVDLTHLVELEIRCLCRQWLANSTGFTTSHLRHC